MKRFKLPVGALIVLCHILDVSIIIACNSHCMYKIIFVEILQELDHHPCCFRFPHILVVFFKSFC